MNMQAGTFAALLVAIGVILPILAWTFFRKEGYNFWTFAPVTKAHRYMDKPGGIIWWTGIAILLVGIFKSWAAP